MDCARDTAELQFCDVQVLQWLHMPDARARTLQSRGFEESFEQDVAPIRREGCRKSPICCLVGARIGQSGRGGTACSYVCLHEGRAHAAPLRSHCPGPGLVPGELIEQDTGEAVEVCTTLSARWCRVETTGGRSQKRSSQRGRANVARRRGTGRSQCHRRCPARSPPR